MATIPAPSRPVAAALCKVSDILHRASLGQAPLRSNSLRPDQVAALRAYTDEIRRRHGWNGVVGDFPSVTAAHGFPVGSAVQYKNGRCVYRVKGTVLETGELLIEIRTAPLASESHRVGQLFTAEPWRLKAYVAPQPIKVLDKVRFKNRSISREVGQVLGLDTLDGQARAWVTFAPHDYRTLNVELLERA